MARTQTTGSEIRDASVEPVDLSESVVPYIRQLSKPSDFISLGDSITILNTRHHLVVCQMNVEGTVILDGTLGIL